MNKILRLSFICILSVLCGTLFAQTTVTFDATTDLSAEGSTAGATSITKDGVTVACSQGVMGNGLQYRFYKSQTVTISSTVGNITGVEFTCTAATGSSKYGPDCFTVTDGTYTYEEKVGTWSGSAAEVVFTATVAQVRATSIVVTVGGGTTDTKKSAGLAFSETSISVLKGSEFTSPTFTKATTATVTFASDNEDVATVNSDGVISLAGGEGTAVITATSEANDEYKEGSAECTISVYTNNVYVKATTITSGKEYLIVAQRNDSTMYAYPISESYKYGYLNAGTIKRLTDTITVKSTYDDAFTITAVDGGYTIQDCYDRYLYQKGTYNSFNVGTDAATWTIEAQSDGTFKIAMNGYFVQWGQTTYKTFGVYTELQENAVMPMLYQLDEVTTGVTNVNAAKPANANAPIYNLAGQRLQKLQKGINIVGGKKVVVKK